MTRALDWDGCWNVRDLGGVPLEGGGETRRGTLVRADNIRGLSDEGWRSLEEHGIARVVDLRWREELAEDPPRDVDVEVVHVSLLGELDPSFSDDVLDWMERDDPGGYWASSYVSMLEEHRPNVGRALGAIADADRPAVFHCAGGKDRTGIVAALLLRNAGVSIEDVAHDYSLSYELRMRGPRAWVNASSDEAELRRRTFMENTPPEAMHGALEYLEREYGSVQGYLRAAGLSEEQLARLRERLVPA